MQEGKNTVSPHGVPFMAARDTALAYWARKIAEELCVSLSTVKSHLGSVQVKLGARNRVEIAAWARESDEVRRR